MSPARAQPAPGAPRDGGASEDNDGQPPRGRYDAWDGGWSSDWPTSGDHRGQRPPPTYGHGRPGPEGGDAWSRPGWPEGYSPYRRDHERYWDTWTGGLYGGYYYYPDYWGWGSWYDRPRYYTYGTWGYDPWWRYGDEYNYYDYGDYYYGGTPGYSTPRWSEGREGRAGEPSAEQRDWVDEKLHQALRDISLAWMIEDIGLLTPYVRPELPIYVQFDWEQKEPWVLGAPMFLRLIEGAFADQTEASFWFEQLEQLDEGRVWALGRHTFKPSEERGYRETYLQIVLRQTDGGWIIETVVGDPDDYRWLDRKRLDDAMQTSAEWFDYLATQSDDGPD